MWRLPERTGASGSDYTNREALKEIRDAYDLNNRKPRTEVIVAMAKVIQRQKDNNAYIYKHMIDGAFDILVEPLNDREIEKLILIARRRGEKATYEPQPKHIHIQF